MESNYAAERATASEVSTDAGKAPEMLSPKTLLARRIEEQGNAIYAVSMLLKMADEDKLNRLSQYGEVSSLYEPFGYLVGILSDEVIHASNELGLLP